MSQTIDNARAQAGELVAGRYRLDSLLGRGGMAGVWRSRDTVLGRDVALKLFDYDMVPVPHATGGAIVPGMDGTDGTDGTVAASGDSPISDPIARAGAEVRILARLNHPNLVAVYDAVCTEPGRFDCLVMELVDGPTLRDRLRAGALPQAEGARLGAEIATGLAYVHAQGVVHRDLKPANILLEHTGDHVRAKIADFGVARLVDEAQITVAGTTVGTANYLSPEQATGAVVGPPSDVYALGLVLLECLTGVTPFPGSGVAAASARLHRDPYIPPKLDARWHRLLRAMTDRDPAARPDAAAVAAELRSLAGAADAPTTALAMGEDAPTAVLGIDGIDALAPAGTSVLPAESAEEFTPVGDGAGPAGRSRPGQRAALIGAAASVAAVALIAGFVASLGGGGSAAAPATTPTTASSPATPAAQPVAASTRATLAATTHRRTQAATHHTSVAPAKAPAAAHPPKKHGPPGHGHGPKH